MRRRASSALVAALVCGSGYAFGADVALLDTLYCVPDLPASRVVAEFSRLLDGPECASTMARVDIGTHLIGINECRAAPVAPGSERCKIFSFQINNMNSPQAGSAVPRFVLRGGGRWCRHGNGDWYPDEPDHFLTPVVASTGPRLPTTTCAMPEWWRRWLIANVPPSPPVTPPPVTPPVTPPPVAAAPTPAPPVTPTPPVAASPQRPRPLCRADYAGACVDLAKLRYLTNPTASDDDLRRAVGEFLADEREAVPAGLPAAHDLERSTATAVGRSKSNATCALEKAVAGRVVACGRS